MKDSVQMYLDEIIEAKKEIAEAISQKQQKISDREPLSSVVKAVQDFNTTCFYTDKKDVIIKIKGTGSITVICDSIDKTTDLNEEDYTTISFNHEKIGKRQYLIKNIGAAADIDISNNDITDIVLDETNHLVKIVAYNNKIENINCSHCPKLQFLHIFNNPMCSDEETMWRVIKSLPNRNEQPFGSIILYDWINLGLCGHYDKNTKAFYYDKEYQYRIKAESLYSLIEDKEISSDEEIFRDVDSFDHPWYKYQDGAFIELSDYNSMIRLRRKLEGYNESTKEYSNYDGSIFKNWMFGSAIQYNEEAWKYCDFPFKVSNVADIWETAEKGEGAGIGMHDYFNFTSPMTQYSRVHPYSYLDYPSSKPTAGGVEPVERYVNEEDGKFQETKQKYPWFVPGMYKNATYHNDFLSEDPHGDACLGMMNSRGRSKFFNTTYGTVPEARYYTLSFGLFSRTGYDNSYSETSYGDWYYLIGQRMYGDEFNITPIYTPKIHSKIEDDFIDNDLNLFSRSLGGFSNVREDTLTNFLRSLREITTKVFDKTLAFNSMGNSGDGFGWTDDSPNNTDSTTQSIWTDVQMGAYMNYVSSVSHSNQISTYTCNDRSVKPYRYNFAEYGEGVRIFSPVTKKLKTVSGTSEASPICTGKCALLMVIFSKLKGYYKINDYYAQIENHREEFLDFLKRRTDNLIDEIRYTAGNGLVKMLQYNKPDNRQVDYILSTFKNTTQKQYQQNPLHQIVQYKNNGVLVDGAQRIETNINDIVVANRKNTAIIPLVTTLSSDKKINIYTNDLNEIESSSVMYGRTDDYSLNTWYNELNIGQIESESDIDKLKISNAIIEPVEYSNSLDISNGWQQCTDSWTFNLIVHYNRPTEDEIQQGWVASGNKKTYSVSAPIFTVQDLNNQWGISLDFKASVQRTYQATPSPSGEKSRLQLRDTVGYVEDADVDYVSCIMDFFQSKDTNVHRKRGYLGQCDNKDFIITLVKRPGQTLIDFYTNGQYIISHQSSHPNPQINGYSFSFWSERDNEENEKHIQIKYVNLYNRALSDEEVLSQVCYLHGKHILNK